MASGYQPPVNDTQRGGSEYDTSHVVTDVAGHGMASRSMIGDFQTPFGEIRNGGDTGNTGDEVKPPEDEKCQEFRQETGSSGTRATMQLMAMGLLMYGPLVIEKQQELRNVKEHCKKLELERQRYSSVIQHHQRAKHLTRIIKKNNEVIDEQARRITGLERENEGLKDELKRKDEQLDDLMSHLDRQNDPEIRGGDIVIRERNQ